MFFNPPSYVIQKTEHIDLVDTEGHSHEESDEPASAPISKPEDSLILSGSLPTPRPSELMLW